MQSPWAVILCKFQGSTGEPFPMQYYLDLFTVSDKGSPWNMVRYFSDYSHGILDLSGSKVFGWYQLVQTVQDYNTSIATPNAPNLGGRGQLIKWARAAAKSAGVNNLSSFFSTVVCTNAWVDIGAWNASAGPPPYGVVAQGTTPIPAVLGEEMGHVYGLMHSRVDGSDADYQDPWDGMSA